MQLQLYFRPVNLNFKEVSRSEAGATYEIVATVHFFSDEAQTRFVSEKEVTLSGVPFKPDWVGIMTDVYTLIASNI